MSWTAPPRRPDVGTLAVIVCSIIFLGRCTWTEAQTSPDPRKALRPRDITWPAFSAEVRLAVTLTRLSGSNFHRIPLPVWPPLDKLTKHFVCCILPPDGSKSITAVYRGEETWGCYLHTHTHTSEVFNMSRINASDVHKRHKLLSCWPPALRFAFPTWIPSWLTLLEDFPCPFSFFMCLFVVQFIS